MTVIEFKRYDIKIAHYHLGEAEGARITSVSFHSKQPKECS